MVDLAQPGEGFTPGELALATRNRGMPLEAMRYDITPVGMHYLLVHSTLLDTRSGRSSTRWGVTLMGEHGLE